MLSSQVDYTLTNYAEHVSDVSHDLVKLYLERERLTASDVWLQVKPDIVISDVEQFHREVKQLTGIDKCQCRKQRIQRNHIACAIHVWVNLKKIAYQTAQTAYQIKKKLLKNYLINELKNPSVLMSFS